MQLNEFLDRLPKNELSTRQLSNLKGIKKISDKFHREAGISKINSRIDKDTIVLESGHQPNYHLDNSISLFGFADYKIPAVTKTGSEKIGLRINKKEKWKSFNALEKPSEQEFKKEIEHIKNHYRQYFPMTKYPLNEIIDKIEEIMWKSHDLSKNLSDLNAFIFSRICTEIWNLQVNFFRYSDMQKEGVFLEEWKKLIDNLDGIPPLEENAFPLWHHCNCGGKVPLLVKSKNPLICTGTCLSCKKTHELNLQDLKENFSRMSLTGVARNLIFSEGLGTSLYTSGSGGGIRYGKISNELSKKLGFHLPITLAWQSKDFYLGISHMAGLHSFTKNFNLSLEEILQEDLLRKIESSNTNTNKLKSRYEYSKNQLKILSPIFNLTPSILELFITFGIPKVLEIWKESFSKPKIEHNDEFYIIQKDIIYNSKIVEKDKILIVYEKLSQIAK